MADDVHSIQDAISRGDADSARRLLPLVYADLKQLARAYMRREAPGQSLQTTGLVHEAYLRIVVTEGEAG